MKLVELEVCHPAARLACSNVMPAGAKAASTARAMRCAAAISAQASASEASIRVSSGALVATITWPGFTWEASMKAKMSSSSYTLAQGSSPEMMRSKMVGMGAPEAFPGARPGG